ncbi:MAG TPA: HEAT repeat domain-containing protein [Planctomycetota bacterium]
MLALLLLAQDVWAEAPALKKAVAVCSDDRGRAYALTESGQVLRFAEKGAAPTVFAELPLKAAGGIAALGEEIWVAGEPSIWALKDRDGDGKADAVKPMFSGFTDLRGPARGPDGKVYFCAGARGFRVLTQEGERLEFGMGAVLRCDVDGANLDVYAFGLKTPSKPTFDDLGDLFLGDEDRVIHALEGSDHGARGASRGEGLHVLPPAGPDSAKAVLDSVVLERDAGRLLWIAGEDFASLKDLKGKSLEDLAALMGHERRRVRLAAQLELVGRQGSTKTLVEAAKSGKERFARIHAIWGLGQLYTRNALFPLLKDPDAEIRAQTARVLGDRRVGDARDGLVQALKDDSPRVRRYAATALGKLGRKEDAKAVAAMLRDNDGKDPALSHAGAHALALIGSGSALQELAKDPSPAVRAGVLVAMRRLARPDLDVFLDDPALALDAARAIHDLPIPGALPRLASKLGKLPDAATPRAIGANVRLGLAEPLVKYATSSAPEALRLEAVRALGTWPAGREALAKVVDALPPSLRAAARE